MTPIDKLPDFDWSETALKEIESVDANGLVQRSTVAVRIRNVVTAGLIYRSMTSPPWFWFLLAKGVTLRDLIDFRRLKEEIPPGALTGVNIENEAAIRFAEFYGFEYTGSDQTYGERVYKIYRRV